MAIHAGHDLRKASEGSTRPSAHATSHAPTNAKATTSMIIHAHGRLLPSGTGSQMSRAANAINITRSALAWRRRQLMRVASNERAIPAQLGWPSIVQRWWLATARGAAACATALRAGVHPGRRTDLSGRLTFRSGQ